MTMASAPASGPAEAQSSVASVPASAPISGRISAHTSAPIMDSASLALGHQHQHPHQHPNPNPNPAPATGPPTKAAASNLSEVDRGRIVGMWEAGRKPTAIALAIPCSKRTACKWINAYRNCGKEGLIDLRRSGLAGRPRKTTEDENLAILKVVDENHTRAATSSALAALQLRVSDRTIRRRLQEARAERRKRPAASHRSRVKAVHTNNKEKQAEYVQGELPPTSRMESMKDTLSMHDRIEPSALVEVNMDTHTPPLDAHLLADTGPCCYVNL